MHNAYPRCNGILCTLAAHNIYTGRHVRHVVSARRKCLRKIKWQSRKETPKREKGRRERARTSWTFFPLWEPFSLFARTRLNGIYFTRYAQCYKNEKRNRTQSTRNKEIGEREKIKIDHIADVWRRRTISVEKNLASSRSIQPVENDEEKWRNKGERERERIGSRARAAGSIIARV